MANFYKLYNISREEAITEEEHLSEGEVETLEEDIQNDNDVMDVSIEQAIDLQEQVDNNEQVLEDNPESITEEMVQASNEALAYALGRLNVDKDTFNKMKVSYESELSAIEKFKVSTESIKDTIANILKKIKAFFVMIMNKVKEWWNKLATYFGFTKKKAQTIKDAAEDINNLKMIQQNVKKNVEKIDVSDKDKKIKELLDALGITEEQLKDPEVDEAFRTVVTILDELSGDEASMAAAMEVLEEFVKSLLEKMNQGNFDDLGEFKNKNMVSSLVFLTGGNLEIGTDELIKIYKDAVSDNATLAAQMMINNMKQGTILQPVTNIKFTPYQSRCFKRLNVLLEQETGIKEPYAITDFNFGTFEVKYIVFLADQGIAVEQIVSLEKYLTNVRYNNTIRAGAHKDIIYVCNYITSKNAEAKKLDNMKSEYNKYMEDFKKELSVLGDQAEIDYLNIVMRAQQELHKILLTRSAAYKHVHDAVIAYLEFITPLSAAAVID